MIPLVMWKQTKGYSRWCHHLFRKCKCICVIICVIYHCHTGWISFLRKVRTTKEKGSYQQFSITAFTITFDPLQVRFLLAITNYRSHTIWLPRHHHTDCDAPLIGLWPRCTNRSWLDPGRVKFPANVPVCSDESELDFIAIEIAVRHSYKKIYPAYMSTLADCSKLASWVCRTIFNLTFLFRKFDG